MIESSSYPINLNSIQNIFFIGIAGFGMSALAQYTKRIGKNVYGSDRNFQHNLSLDIKQKLEKLGIKCYQQDSSGINSNLDVVVVSSIVSSSNTQRIKSEKLGIKIITRSDLLSLIVNSKKSICVGGTSGKSTTTAMIYHILKQCGQKPSIITGAGLIDQIEKGMIGNCIVGQGQWLVVEVDQSDGSITKYKSQIGVLLNISKDHKEIKQLESIFEQFKNNSKYFVRNSNLIKIQSSNPKFQIIHLNQIINQIKGEQLKENKFQSYFSINQIPFQLKLRGDYNLENALASIAACSLIIPSLEKISSALSSFRSVSRRCQYIGQKNGIIVVDDYAHNPAKCKAIIRSLKPISKKLIVWFQPHGFESLRFLRKQFEEMFVSELRETDLLWINEAYFALGSDAVKTISSQQLVKAISDKGIKCYYIEQRSQLSTAIKKELQNQTIILLMGARDPTLSAFAHRLFELI